LFIIVVQGIGRILFTSLFVMDQEWHAERNIS